MLSEGLGIDQDPEAAAYWLLRAAQQGHSGAQVLLAESFESGNGVPVNRNAAKTWYQKAAEQGDHIAQYRFGQLLLNGDDEEKKDAVSWLRLAAEGGCADAQAQLVEVLMKSAAPNRDELLKWASSAADSGASKAHYLLGSVIENFFDITRIEDAVASYRKSAEQGFTDAQIRLGKLYAEGKIVAQDQKEAERWLAMVVADGNAPVSSEMTDSSKLSSLAPFMTVNEYPPGSIIDNKYFIMSVLGRGGMCMVYKAKHLLMNKMVALKMLLPESAADAGLVERFKREAQAASSLNHPNVITIYDLGVSPDGKPFMVMDYLEGQSLEERIQALGPIPVEQLVPIFVQVCAALEVAHEVGIIHRDIKPSNIMLINTKAQADHVKVVDFGLAKLMTDESSQKLTKSGEVFGTLMYMSPEQCLGHPLDVRTDIYSVGCTMYEAATAQPPFRAPTPFELMNKHVNHAPQPMSATAPEIKVPQQLEAIVAKTLAKNREERFQTITELREALAALEKQPKKGWFK
jgi:TPR repeat protein